MHFTSWRRSCRKERTLNIPLFKADCCSNIQGKQGGKLFGKSWEKISYQNEVKTRSVQMMIDAPIDSRVYLSIRESSFRCECE